MRILKGIGGMKLGIFKSKEGEPKIISLWEPRAGRGRLQAGSFIDELMQLSTEELDAVSEEQLQQKLSEFKEKNNVQETDDERFDLMLLHAVGLQRQLDEREAILVAGGKIPEEDVPVTRVVDVLDRIFEKYGGF